MKNDSNYFISFYRPPIDQNKHVVTVISLSVTKIDQAPNKHSIGDNITVA